MRTGTVVAVCALGLLGCGNSGDANGLKMLTPRVQDRPETLTLPEHHVVLHHFDVDESVGTVLLVHGYFDHAFTWSDYIDYLTGRSWSVSAIDLPGHGHSSGERAGIDRFDTYTLAVHAAVEAMRARGAPPDAVIAHSTGGGVVMETLLTQENPPLAPSIVLVAPLVRSAKWALSRRVFEAVGRWVPRVPRFFSANSKDGDFRARMKSDPLQARWVPRSFPRALYRWNDRLMTYAPSSAEALVVQGDHDATLEWKFNLAFIEERLPNAEVRVVTGGPHHLVFDTEPVRTTVRSTIDDWLQARSAIRARSLPAEE